MKDAYKWSQLIEKALKPGLDNWTNGKRRSLVEFIHKIQKDAAETAKKEIIGVIKRAWKN